MEPKQLLTQIDEFLSGKTSLDKLVEQMHALLKKSNYFDNPYVVRHVVATIGMRELTIEDENYAQKYRKNIEGMKYILEQFIEKGTDPYDIADKTKRAYKLRQLFTQEVSAILFIADPMGINFDDNRTEYDSEADKIVSGMLEAKDKPDVAAITIKVFELMFEGMIHLPQKRSLKKIADKIYHVYDISYPALHTYETDIADSEKVEDQLDPLQLQILALMREIHKPISNRADIEITTSQFGNVELKVKSGNILTVTLKPKNRKASPVTVEVDGGAMSVYLRLEHFQQEMWWKNMKTLEHSLIPNLVQSVIKGGFQEWVEFNDKKEPTRGVWEFDIGEIKPIRMYIDVLLKKLWHKKKNIKHFTYETY